MFWIDILTKPIPPSILFDDGWILMGLLPNKISSIYMKLIENTSTVSSVSDGLNFLYHEHCAAKSNIFTEVFKPRCLTC